MPENASAEPLIVVTDSQSLFHRFHAKYPQSVLRAPHLDQFADTQGTHFQFVMSKRDFNLQLLIDFFLLMYAENCISDGESLLSKMARFMRVGSYQKLLGSDSSQPSRS